MLARWLLLPAVAAALALPSVGRAATGEERLRRDAAASVPAGVTVHVRSRAAAAPGFRILEILASAEGIAFDAPLGRALLDEATGRIVMPVRPTPVVRMTGSARPARDELDAVARVEATGLRAARGATAARRVWRVRDGEARPVWRVEPPLDPVAMEAHVFWVDDADGSVAMSPNFVAAAAVRAYPENPVTTPTAEVFVSEMLPEGAQDLSNAEVIVRTCSIPQDARPPDLPDCGLAIAAAPDENGDFLFDPAPDGFVVDDAFAEGSLYWHAERFLTAMHAAGLGPLFCETFSGDRTVLVANYHYADGPLGNAYYPGFCDAAIVMGQGARADSSYSGDVVYHELGHLVGHTLAGHRFNDPVLRGDAFVLDAAAVYEGLADFLSAAHIGDPIMDEYFSSAPRNLDNELACPTDLEHQQHADGRLLSGVLWRLHERHGEDVLPTVLDAIAMMPDAVGLEQAAVIVHAVVEAELGQAAADLVAAEITARSLHDCVRVMAHGRDVYVPLLARSDYTWVPGVAQLRVDVPPDAEEMIFSVFTFDGPTLFPSDLMLRRGEPVEFTPGRGRGEIEATFDLAWTDVGALEVLTVAVVGGEPVYLAFANDEMLPKGAAISALEFGHGDAETGDSSSSGAPSDDTTSGDDTTSAGTTLADSSTSGEPTGGTGGGALEAEDGGCGCRGAGPAPRGLFVLALGVWLRRRR